MAPAVVTCAGIKRIKLYWLMNRPQTRGRKIVGEDDLSGTVWSDDADATVLPSGETATYGLRARTERPESLRPTVAPSRPLIPVLLLPHSICSFTFCGCISYVSTKIMRTKNILKLEK